MGRYDRLAELLAGREGDVWEVGFEELEGLLGLKLPASAYKYPAWWSNDPANNPMTKVWLRAGWKSGKVDVPNRRLVFRRRREEPYAPPPDLEYKAFGIGPGGRPLWSGPPYEVKAVLAPGGPGYGREGMTPRARLSGYEGRARGEEDGTEAGADHAFFRRLRRRSGMVQARNIAGEDPLAGLYGCLEGMAQAAPEDDLRAPDDADFGAD